MSTADTAALLEGTVACHAEDELRERLGRGRPLRVKFGVDPSSPDLHLGHAVPLRHLRRWQDAGHTAVLIIGDATAMVGDPTGKNATRPQLSREQVQAHAATYLAQAFMVLDRERTEVVHNSAWFDRMGFMEAVTLGASMTVARMLERDTFETRYRAGVPIGIHEFLYPLMQARDSVEVRPDVEIGGSDQTFNLLVGRDLMRDADLEPQICITLPLLVGLDGEQKMSKSLGNAIGLTEPPRDMYGKAMSLPDALMPDWFPLTTPLRVEGEPAGDGALALVDGRQGARARPERLAPRDAKARLAFEIVAAYHGEAAAREAAEEFDRVFRDKGLPDEVPASRLPPELVEGDGVWIVRALTAVGLADSSGEARRLIRAGGVRVDDERVGDEQARLAPGGSYLLRVGKRRFHRVEVPA